MRFIYLFCRHHFSKRLLSLLERVKVQFRLRVPWIVCLWWWHALIIQIINSSHWPNYTYEPEVLNIRCEYLHLTTTFLHLSNRNSEFHSDTPSRANQRLIMLSECDNVAFTVWAPLKFCCFKPRFRNCSSNCFCCSMCWYGLCRPLNPFWYGEGDRLGVSCIEKCVKQ